MCGIVGRAGTTPAADREILGAQCDTLRHRGPDAEGVWWSEDGRVGLGHRRLAVVDLSPTGDQPMHDGLNQLHLIFNGEIYNHRELHDQLASGGYPFRGPSDTEVILAAYRKWGVDCVTHLNGMFAFALYDERQHRLFLARDRAGEKPLFYVRGEHSIVFASELKALFAGGQLTPTLDLAALQHYFAYGYVPHDLCMIKQAAKLPAAHAMVFDLETNLHRVWRYWDLPAGLETAPEHDDEALLNELETLLEDSVRRQLIADVPVGILLSGGLDSSLVTAMATRVSAEPVRTFTVRFPGHGKYDEGPHARAIASFFGTNHTELVAEPATVSLLPQLARQFDEPIADSSMVPMFLVSQQVRRAATVALGGDGGDELFGGYPHHSWIQRQEGVRRFVPAPLRRVIAGCGHAMPVGVRGRNHAIGFGRDLSHSLAHLNLYFDSATRSRLLAPALRLQNDALDAPERFRIDAGSDRHSPLQRATAADFRTYMTDDILVKVDRASMLTSLEVRAPFLDYRIIELAFGRVPDRLRATSSERKVLLRRLAKRVLPSSLDLRRKQGFSIPLDSWLRDDWGKVTRETLAELPRQLFDQGAVDRLLDDQALGLSNAQRLFSLMMFELWRREYGVALPT